MKKFSKDIVFGYVPSTMDGSEHHFTGEYEQELPNAYSYREYLPPVLNQGELSICVPCSVWLLFCRIFARSRA